MTQKHPLLKSDHAAKLEVSDDGKKVYWGGRRVILLPRLWAWIAGIAVLLAAVSTFAANMVQIFKSSS